MNNIAVKNFSPDSYNSILLNELASCIRNRFRLTDAEICVEHVNDETAKCELSVVISLVTGISTGLIANAIYDYMKILLARHPDKRHQTWTIEIVAENIERVTVASNHKGDIEIQIEDIK
ncbi:MAG: hypothetical protein E7318_05700 [Clostridiales bacterium]|nr:hypothetical protein [Clostridiales bacterium]